MAQLVRASPAYLFRAERHGFESRSDYHIYQYISLSLFPNSVYWFSLQVNGSWGCAKKGIKVLPTLETDRKVDKFWNSVTFHTLYSTRVPKVINFNVVYGLIVYEMFLHRMNLYRYRNNMVVA